MRCSVTVLILTEFDTDETTERGLKDAALAEILGENFRVIEWDSIDVEANAERATA